MMFKPFIGEYSFFLHLLLGAGGLCHEYKTRIPEQALERLPVFRHSDRQVFSLRPRWVSDETNRSSLPVHLKCRLPLC